ncbi:site-specific integrase [Draconibacterium sp.]|uniref:site-specific integrase n=1 Tax=Draconibacterium sp. TaxID=1965318 RepID=UPI0026254330|nr:site-specific integrase [uncultured Draconibacterium sp.]
MRVIIHFYPRKSRLNDDGQLPIYVRFTVKSKRVDLSTGLFIQPKHWSDAKGRVKDRAPNAYTVNERLDKLKTEIQDYYNQLRSSGEEFSVSTIKDYLLEVDNKTGVLEVFDYYLESMLAKTGGYSKETYKHYKSSRKRLATFIKDRYKKNDYPVQTIKFGFLDAFDVYLKQKYKVHQNTAWNYHKHLRRVLNLAISMEHISINPYKKYKVGLAPTHREILTSDELDRLEQKKIQIKRLAIVRDIFVFACYTGLSYSDIHKLNKNHLHKGIDKKDWIIIDRTKTDTRCRIPLLPKAKQLLDKYSEYPTNENSGKLLPVLSNQKMNGYLKELGDICGINKDITMHIARHTFATSVTLANGVPIETVSKILGHSSLKTTQIYAKVLDQKISEDMDMLQTKLSEKKKVI